MLGDYGTNNGRIAELNPGFNPANPTGPSNPYSINHDTFEGQVERTAREGDADLNGAINFDDFTTLFLNYNAAGAWHQGDFTGNGTVTFDDFTELFLKYNQTYTVLVDGTIPGGGSGGGGAVPEPTAAVLALMGGLAFLGRRNRS
jgi:MprA protease rhombosortase-interaction domain-containing protein